MHAGRFPMNCTSTLLGAKLAGSFATLGTQLQGAVPPKYRFPTVPCCARYGADCSESESPYTNHWTAWGGGGVIKLQPVARSPNSAKPTSRPARLRTIDRVLASAHAALAGSCSTSRFDTAGSQLEWGPILALSGPESPIRSPSVHAIEIERTEPPARTGSWRSDHPPGPRRVAPKRARTIGSVQDHNGS